MDPFSDEALSAIFKLSSRNPAYIGARESTVLEFKESFSFAGLPDYARVMASFANTHGGYIVFGVKDKPREPIGIPADDFENLDTARATGELNQTFSPEIHWTHCVHEWCGTAFGLIYTYEHHRKPVVATINRGDAIQAGDILYRYNGRTQRIEFGELAEIIEARVATERESWRHLFERVAAIGPEKAAVINGDAAGLQTMERPLLIDEKALEGYELKEGSEAAKEAQPLLSVRRQAYPAPVIAYRNVTRTVAEDRHRLRPSDVCRKVRNAIGKEFRPGSEHLKAWRYHKVRPWGPPDALPFKNHYCEYKEYPRTYRYSEQWLDSLVAEYEVDENYERLSGLPIEFEGPGEPWA